VIYTEITGEICISLRSEILLMSTLATAPISGVTPPAWSTIRFRRAKDSKGWALLGIPQQVYPVVALRLFEQQARLVSRHDDGTFTSLLFEAPPPLAAKLACVFPAPPGCEALRIAETGDRILSGKASKSTRAIYQRPDPSTADMEAA
jgi:hypothetical protein